jgi:hypothetical protein
MNSLWDIRIFVGLVPKESLGKKGHQFIVLHIEIIRYSDTVYKNMNNAAFWNVTPCSRIEI